jgi:hypothetical protein
MTQSVNARSVNSAIVDLPTKALLLGIVADIGTALGGTISPQPAITALTDSSGGTSGGNTIAAIAVASASIGADTSAATVASVNVSLGEVKNAIATLAAKVNAINAALVAAGVL